MHPFNGKLWLDCLVYDLGQLNRIRRFDSSVLSDNCYDEPTLATTVVSSTDLSRLRLDLESKPKFDRNTYHGASDKTCPAPPITSAPLAS